ncbi:major facilitator superfamily transporter [Seiridium cupressi]
MGSGIPIAATPQIAHHFGLSQALVLWPAAVYALAAGCLLLIFGAMADVVGAEPMWITGSFLFCVFTLALGFAKTSLEIILFRALLGITIAMCLPTAVGLVAHTFPKGSWRNTGFAMNGMGPPLGYVFGLGASFQEIEGLSALQSSIRFIPHPIMGAATNVATAYLISRVKIQTLSVFSDLVTLIAPILIATITVGENYWFAPFWALFLSPMNPDEMQSLAGGVFNEVAQFGNSVGLAITAAVAASVTEHSRTSDHKTALMEGYRAAFWTVFASATLVVAISYFGFRKGGTVGKKDD